MAFKFIIFDLDNTLYPQDSGVMQEIGRRIQLWLCDRLGLTWEEAVEVRRDYLHRYGTTMGGLIAEHSIEVQDYLTFVHEIPIEEYLEPDPALVAMLGSIPLRKVIYTNAISEHAHRVLCALGVDDQFERVIGIEEVDLRNKFNHDAYRRALTLLGAEGSECIMVEDSPRNLPPAKELGLTTILADPSAVDDESSAYADFKVDSVLEVGRVVDQLLDA
jgi:putative hydrolase of the HAD superfamily